HPETGRRLISINNFSQLVPIDDDGYDGLVSTLEATWLNINLNVAKQIEQARL
ncbi:MAG: PqiC family protein, partial [Pseudoalteromonas sp.]